MCWKRVPRAATTPAPAPTPVYLMDPSDPMSYTDPIPSSDAKCSKAGERLCSVEFADSYCSGNGVCCIDTGISEDKFCYCKPNFIGIYCESNKPVDDDFALQGFNVRVLIKEMISGDVKIYLKCRTYSLFAEFKAPLRSFSPKRNYVYIIEYNKKVTATVTATLCVLGLIALVLVACCVLLIVRRRCRTSRRGSKAASTNQNNEKDIELNLMDPSSSNDVKKRDPGFDAIESARLVDDSANDGHAGAGPESRPGLSWRQKSERGGDNFTSTNQSHSTPSDMDKLDLNSNGRAGDEASNENNGNNRADNVNNESRDVIGGKVSV